MATRGNNIVNSLIPALRLKAKCAVARVNIIGQTEPAEHKRISLETANYRDQVVFAACAVDKDFDSNRKFAFDGRV